LLGGAGIAIALSGAREKRKNTPQQGLPNAPKAVPSAEIGYQYTTFNDTEL
jgi:hypothetical protein